MTPQKPTAVGVSTECLNSPAKGKIQENECSVPNYILLFVKFAFSLGSPFLKSAFVSYLLEVSCYQHYSWMAH